MMHARAVQRLVGVVATLRGREDALDAWIAGALASARATWPGLERHDETFDDFLAEKVRALPEPDAYEALRTGDLYLAHACLACDAAAVEAFVSALFPRLDRQLARVRTPAAIADDVKSALREQLFFGRTSRAQAPLLAGYSGRGDLASWLRSIGLRMASRARHDVDRNVVLESNDGAILTPTEPELELLRRTYAPRLETALVEALGDLPERDRELLRQHYLDALSLEAVAALHGVHRATAARWLADARTSVLRGVEDTLRAEGPLTDSELESLLRSVAREIAPSLTRILAIPRPPH